MAKQISNGGVARMKNLMFLRLHSQDARQRVSIRDLIYAVWLGLLCLPLLAACGNGSAF